MALSRIDPQRVAPALLAAALAALYLAWQPPSLDLAAAEYRAWLFGHTGFAAWDLQWYAGHHLPGYSVLSPPLAAWLGPRLLAALCAVATALLFERLAHGRYGERAWLGAVWLGAGTATLLLSGRVTFALGLVPAFAALLALQRGRVALATGLALVTPFASPVAALFLALAGVACAIGARRRAGIALALGALVPVIALAVAFPEGGSQPFAASSFWTLMAFAVLSLVLLPREERTLRVGVALYALGCTAAFLLDTPVGGNAARLGALLAGPLAALVWWRRRMLALVLVAPLLGWWQWDAAIDDVRTARGDVTVRAAYYAPLIAFLAEQDGPPGRLEIPFTRLHWEAYWVAGGRDAIPLARGWERQLDRKVNAVLYDRTLTPARYRAWLDRMGVRWVALPDTRLDYSALAEVRLIERGLPYLHEIWTNRDWRVFAVEDPAPLVDPPARVTALETDAVALTVTRPANVRLRMHWTPYWAVVAGAACVEPAGDFTRVRMQRAGTVRLEIRFSVTRVRARSPRCAASATNRGDEAAAVSG
jgi:hypothetical protein